MRSLLKYFLISFCFVVNADKRFRFDYTYYSDIDGWLKLHVIPATWHDAFMRCDAEGSVVASPIDTKMKSSMILHTKRKNNNNANGIFSGVHATFSKGDFFSIEGVSLSRMPLVWAKGEPNNVNNNEDCILFYEDGTIADVDCSNTYPYMCFKRRTKNMVVTSCGTVNKDYEFNPATGNCYKFHGVGNTWREAFMTCAAEGGYLVIINSQDEAEYLKNLFEKNSNKIVAGANKEIILVGNHDWGNHGVWRTIHGMKLHDAGYAEWNTGQPDNSTSGQFCGAMFNNSKLDDYWCGGLAPFVCEKNPNSLLEDNYNI